MRIFFIISIFIFSIISMLSAQNFTNVTEGEIVNNGGWNYACCWADFNGDGHDDLFVCNNDSNNGKHNFLSFTKAEGTFTRIRDGEIITDSNSSYGCTPADYDNDGDIDLFVANYNENNCLYNNNGDGTFTKITNGSIVNNSGKSTGCEWYDYDLDGWLDIYIANRDEANFLYHNEGDGTFTRITTGSLVTQVKNSGDCLWGDFNQDGYPDLLVANSGPDYISYFLNNGNGTFTENEDDAITNDHESFDALAAGDIDGDGDLDVMAIPGMLPAYVYDLYFYLNNGDGSFMRLPGIPHAGINSGGGVSFVDFDYDGVQEIVVNAYDGNNIVLENDGAGNLSQVGEGLLVTSGSYNKQPDWTDFDRDGDLDIFIAVNNYFGGNNKLLCNDGIGNNWLEITCVGTVTNKNGIGAKVSISSTISGNYITQTQYVDSGNSLITYFGLGDSETIDQITINWPSGLETTLNDIEVNQRLVLTEDVICNPPQNVSWEFIDNTALITWDQPAEGSSSDFVCYGIYRDNTILGCIDETEFLIENLINGEEYFYWITAMYEIGESAPAVVQFTYEGIDADDDEIPANSYGLTNYPNPFNPTTTITFNISNQQNEPVEISIFNLKGQKVKKYSVSNDQFSITDHQISIPWDGTDDHDDKVASGIYQYILIVDGKIIASNKCLLLK